MKIGEVAQSTGVTVQTIRFYEDRTLLRSHYRTKGGYRIFSARDIERLEFIKKAKRLGLSLLAVRKVLAITHQGEASCAHVREVLAQKIAEADTAIRELKEFRGALIEMVENAGPIQDCRPSGGRICAIIEQAPPLTQPAVLQRMERRKTLGD